MLVYRRGSQKDHGPTLIARNVGYCPDIYRDNPFGDGPYVQFREACCEIDNLQGYYDVYVDMDLKDVVNLIQTLAKKAEDSDEFLAHLTGNLATCRQALVKLTAMAHGYGPMPTNESENE